MSNVKWADAEHHQAFLVRLHGAQDDLGTTGYGFASVSDITEWMHDNAWERAFGDADSLREFTLWRMTPRGPAIARVHEHMRLSARKVEVKISWYEPIDGGKYDIQAESGYYDMVEA